MKNVGRVMVNYTPSSKVSHFVDYCSRQLGDVVKVVTVAVDLLSEALKRAASSRFGFGLEKTRPLGFRVLVCPIG